MQTLTIANALSTGKIRIVASGVDSVNQDFLWTTANIIPPGFESVCVKNGWNTHRTWKQLNSDRPWLRGTKNDAYVYLNSMDDKWWIDKPDGNGVFIASKRQQGKLFLDAPPKTGWEALSPSYNPTPSIEIFSAKDK